MVQQTADDVAGHVDAHGPTGAQVTEHVGHVRYAGIHQAAVGQGLAEVHRLAIDVEPDAAHDTDVETGCGDDDIGFQ